jgi:maltoporin
MNNNLFEQYAETEKKIAELELVKDLLKKEIFGELKANDIKSYPTAFGSFTVVARKQYKFSKDVEELAMTLKEKQEDEKENGVAKVTIAEHLQYKKNK